MNDHAPGGRPLAKWVRHGTIRIQDPEVHTRLDRYLSGRFTYRSRTQWARIIDARRILVNGRACRPSRVVTFGDRIDYVPLRRPEPPVRAHIGVLHEDEDLLAVNKPPDIPVHPSGRYFRNTLLCLLLESRGETLDEPGVRIVHRLDRETSGIVVFGKSRAATAALAGQFERREAAKEYLLVVHGVPPHDRFRVEATLGAARDSRVRKAVGVVSPQAGRPAVTEFAVVARGPGHALLRAHPLTGRLHQIRVHARHAGFPVVGDKLYGLDEEFFLKLAAGLSYTPEERRRLLIPRQALHAHRLEVRHPRTGAALVLTAPLPSDLVDLCRSLGIDGGELTDRDEPQPHPVL